MDSSDTDFNTKLKKISKELVESFLQNDNSSKFQKINDENTESSISSHNLEQNFSYSEIVVHTIKDILSNRLEKNKNKRLILTEQTTKSSITNNYFPQKEKNKISEIKPKIHNNIKINKNKFTSDLNQTYSTSERYSIFKAQQESAREKKFYEEKIKLIHNHIEALKKQQSYLSKKAQKEKEEERYKNKIKKEKQNIKQALLAAEIDKRNEIESKRKSIAQQKIKEQKEMMDSKVRKKNYKLNEYKKAYIQKKEMEKIIIEDNNKNNKVHKLLIDKIKLEREKNRNKLIKEQKNYIDKINNSYRLSHHNNLIETKKLKNELIKLEKVEKQYLQKMKYTQDNFRENKFKKINNVNKKYIKMKSFGDLDKKDNNQIKINKGKSNSVMKRYIINNENNPI